MKTMIFYSGKIVLSGLLFIFLLAFAERILAQENCEVSKDMGEGYTTRISSVTDNGNDSYTIVLIVEHGTCIGSPCKQLVHYSVEADPGTYSGISVQTLYGQFGYASIDYGPNLGGDPFQGFRINNTNGMGSGEATAFSITYTLSGDLQDQQVLAQAANLSLIVLFSEDDFEDVLECQSGSQNIFPYYTPPDGGKVYDLIGSELTSLYNTYLNSGTYISDDIFQVVGASVSIEILTQPGQYSSAITLLTGPSYGLTSYSGDPAKNTITGLFPILNLLSLNALPTLIVQARPNYSALSNVGLVTSQGDTSLRSYLARTGFNVNGAGIKIGVISDSYNTQLGNQAADDVLRKDLPGATNPDYPDPVDVVKEFPYGTRSDEGRAMLQIVHDVAPGADLAFRTGFLGPADFAQGIRELQQAGCNIIVDDITYISEPFFRDGLVSAAVDEVSASGVTYFSAAGNFGTKSYQQAFYPTTAPDGITGQAQNFAGPVGGTDIYQSITLVPGNYTVVLQWDDGTPGNATSSDFDIYLTRQDGTTLFGFNRVNTGGPAVEVLPFTVVGQNALTNFMIIRASGTGAATLKYVIFRGDVQINEYATPGASTLVGQPNAAGAIAVGAVLYSNTPEYGVNPPTVASFSSRGGTPVNGINRNKPEICAPNGVNTSVNLGGVNIDGDAFPNFFGTSAAAPHAAAVAALIQEARLKYYGSAFSPGSVKSLLQGTAIDMYAAGYDAASGAGFIQADAALGELANPKPYITAISFDTTLTPGVDPIILTVYGGFLTSSSEIYFNGLPLGNPTALLGDTAVRATIPPFDALYPMIQVYNPPKTGTNGTDGGLSNPLYFTTKETIVINIDEKSKVYGEQLPEFTAQYSVESTEGTFTLEEAGLNVQEISRIHDIDLTTVANSLSNTGLWGIEADPNDPLNPESGVPATDSLDISLLERYNIDVVNGLLTIDTLELLIRPQDTVLTYGQVPGGFNFDFFFNNDTVNTETGLNISDADSLSILSAFSMNYATALVNGTALVYATALVNAGVGATALVNKSYMISNSTFNLFATALVNGTFVTGPQFVTATALVNTVSFTGNSAMAPATALVNGDVVVNNFSGSGATALVNAGQLINSFSGATALVNTNTVNGDNNSDAIVIMGGGDISILSGDSTGNVDLRGINIITGNTVGQHYILPGSYLSNNFKLTYMFGSLTILPDTADVTINPAGLLKTYSATPKTVAVTTSPTGLNVIKTYNGSTTPPVNAGTYTMIAYVNDPNYVGADTATLVINKAPATVTADLKWIYDYDPLPAFTATFSGFLGNDNASCVTSLTFSVSPTYTGVAGTYQIHPVATAQNYLFTSVNGPLYVNPNGNGTKQIKPKLRCVEKRTAPDPQGFWYVANYEYDNDNSTDVYIPKGSDNYFSGQAQYNGVNQPVLFKAGGGAFTVPFDGNKLTWTVVSYKNNGQKGGIASAASSSSARCNKSEEADAPPVVNVDQSTDIKAFPNPTDGKLYLELGSYAATLKDIAVYDIYGKLCKVPVSALDAEPVEIDLSGLKAGLYLVRINTGDSIKTIQVVKK
jgi:hypothetical protein